MQLTEIPSYQQLAIQFGKQLKALGLSQFHDFDSHTVYIECEGTYELSPKEWLRAVKRAGKDVPRTVKEMDAILAWC